MRRLFGSSGLVLILSLFAAPSTSFAQQALSLSIGGFVPRSEDARSPNDVLVNNLDFLSFRVSDFKGASVNGEWLVGLNEFLDAGLGIGVYSQTVPSVYSLFVNSDNTEIEQDLRLRIVPFTATVRFLPVGRHAPVEPYIGAGVGVFAWRYSETGQFIDPVDASIFRDTFTGSGAAVGPVILGGVTFPAGNFSLGGEIRYQAAKGDLPASEQFAGSKIDLGGFTYSATFKVRF
jgi:hypothetical protein